MCGTFHFMFYYSFITCRQHTLGAQVQLTIWLCNENVPLKHPIPMNTYLSSMQPPYDFCTCSHVSFLLGPGMKQFILLLLLSMTFGLSSLFEFRLLVVFILHFSGLPASCMLFGCCQLPSVLLYFSPFVFVCLL